MLSPCPHWDLGDQKVRGLAFASFNILKIKKKISWDITTWKGLETKKKGA